MIDSPPLRPAFPHPGNAADDLDCLATIDRWLLTGEIDKIDATAQQQQWPKTSLGDIQHAWFKLTGLYPGQGPIEYGHGWRFWYTDGRILDSRTSTWASIPEKIVLGVSYCGMQRWMFQGGGPILDGHARLRT